MLTVLFSTLVVRKVLVFVQCSNQQLFWTMILPTLAVLLRTLILLLSDVLFVTNIGYCTSAYTTMSAFPRTVSLPFLYVLFLSGNDFFNNTGSIPSQK